MINAEDMTPEEINAHNANIFVKSKKHRDMIRYAKHHHDRGLPTYPQAIKGKVVHRPIPELIKEQSAIVDELHKELIENPWVTPETDLPTQKIFLVGETIEEAASAGQVYDSARDAGIVRDGKKRYKAIVQIVGYVELD